MDIRFTPAASSVQDQIYKVNCPLDIADLMSQRGFEEEFYKLYGTGVSYDTAEIGWLFQAPPSNLPSASSGRFSSYPQ